MAGDGPTEAEKKYLFADKDFIRDRLRSLKGQQQNSNIANKMFKDGANYDQLFSTNNNDRDQAIEAIVANPGAFFNDQYIAFLADARHQIVPPSPSEDSAGSESVLDEPLPPPPESTRQVDDWVLSMKKYIQDLSALRHNKRQIAKSDNASLDEKVQANAAIITTNRLLDSVKREFEDQLTKISEVIDRLKPQERTRLEQRMLDLNSLMAATQEKFQAPEESFVNVDKADALSKTNLDQANPELIVEASDVVPKAVKTSNEALFNKMLDIVKQEPDLLDQGGQRTRFFSRSTNPIDLNILGPNAQQFRSVPPVFAPPLDDAKVQNIRNRLEELKKDLTSDPHWQKFWKDVKMPAGSTDADRKKYQDEVLRGYCFKVVSATSFSSNELISGMNQRAYQIIDGTSPEKINIAKMNSDDDKIINALRGIDNITQRTKKAQDALTAAFKAEPPLWRRIFGATDAWHKEQKDKIDSAKRDLKVLENDIGLKTHLEITGYDNFKQKGNVEPEPMGPRMVQTPPRQSATPPVPILNYRSAAVKEEVKGPTTEILAIMASKKGSKELPQQKHAKEQTKKLLKGGLQDAIAARKEKLESSDKTSKKNIGPNKK